MSKKSLIPIVIMFFLSACGSLSEWKRDIVRGPSPLPWLESSSAPAPQPVARRRPQWSPQALQVHSGAMSSAKDRWPWAEGNQLQRRAQILQLNPDYGTMNDLDSNSDPATEIHILRQLLEQRQNWARY